MCQFWQSMLLMTCCGVFAVPGQDNPPLANAKSDPKESQPVQRDFYGDPLPPGAVARLGTARFRHGDEINAVAFSPKGDMIASAGGSSVRLWDAKTGRQLRLLSDHGWVTSVAFSPDGKLVAAGGNDIVGLWDLATGQKIHNFKMEMGGWLTLAFSPDGKTLAAQSHWAFSRWELASGKELPLNGFKAPVECFAFSPDGKKLLFSGGFAIRCCETETGKELFSLGQDEEQIKAVGFSPDGKTFASVGSKASLRLWDAETGTPIPHFQQYHIWCSSFVFSRDGKTLIVGGSGISSWDVKTGKQIRGFEGHASEVNAVALSSDDRLLATGGRDTIIRLWDVKTGQEIHRFGGHQGEVRAVAFPPDGSFLVSGGGFQDRAFRYWDIRWQKELRPSRRASEVDAVEVPDSPICYVTFSPDGKTMAVGGREIILLRTGTAEELHHFSLREESLVCAAFSPSGKILAGGGVSIHLWSFPEGKELPKFESFDGGISSLAFSPDGALLVS
jgi:WD40 repeat protein